MSVLANHIRRSFYLDSVALMRVSRSVCASAGVEAAALMIGSPANQAILEQSGLLAAAGQQATANDLVIAIRARDDVALNAAMRLAESLIDHPTAPITESSLPRVRRLSSALQRIDAANLALISVPGEFAAREARQALLAGLHVVMFSDNVGIEEEVALKRLAHERGLLMMGPDCGTCFIGGVPIAFANAVAHGRVGIVSASGTGLQEVASLIARGGGGIAHGIGVGGRDLSAAVGGISTLAAIDALEGDPAVERIAIISKPPAPSVIERLLERVAAGRKKYVICLMGRVAVTMPSNATLARTLRAAAEACLGQAIEPNWLDVRACAFTRSSGSLHGLYCGGTLCAEAQGIVLDAGLAVSSNAPIPGAIRWAGSQQPHHSVLDLGDDEYTRGRPHPMIEPEIRSELIVRAMADPAIAVLLLDVVIGYGAHRDPAGVIAAALARCARREAHVIASVTGTDQDPQIYSAQCRTLERSGIVVAPSNAHAAELAVRMLDG